MSKEIIDYDPTSGWIKQVNGSWMPISPAEAQSIDNDYFTSINNGTWQPKGYDDGTQTAQSPQSTKQLGGIGGGIGSLALGLYQTNQANKGIKELHKHEVPFVEVGKELQGAYNTALDNSKYGYLPAQENALRNDIANTSYANTQNALDNSNGQIASAVHGITSANNLGAYNKLAYDNANLKLNNQKFLAGLAGEVQGVQNTGRTQKLGWRQMQEQGLQKAKSDGQNNIASAGNQITSMLMSML